MRERAIEQFHSVPRDQHDPISIQFLTPGSELEVQIMARPRFDQPSDFLRAAVARIRSGSICDYQNETPHSLFKKAHDHSPGSTFAFQSSTVRASQNVQDVEDIMDAVPGVDLQTVWNRCSSVVRADVSRHNRPLPSPPRIPRKRFEERLYLYKNVFDPEVEVR